jgi:hypothetical protein
MGGIYEVRVEMGSGVVILVPSFIKTDLGVQKLTRGLQRHTNKKEIA